MRFSEPMDGQVRVRLSREEKATFTAIARARGLSLSQLLREGAKARAEMIAA